jgi:hypothetical protein
MGLTRFEEREVLEDVSIDNDRPILPLSSEGQETAGSWMEQPPPDEAQQGGEYPRPGIETNGNWTTGGTTEGSADTGEEENRGY